ncbi:MAG: sulfatase-like hydrolase/transferase, partial [Chloroflexota bacterium]
AARSLRFTQSISTCPVCCPWRATLMTGQNPLTHGVFVNDVPVRGEPAYLAQWLGEAGYDTAYISGQSPLYNDFRFLIQDSAIEHFVGPLQIDSAADFWTGPRDSAVTDAAIAEWGRLKEPFLAVVHYSNIHAPRVYDRRYAPFQPVDRGNPSPSNEKYKNYYKDVVYLSDLAVGKLLRAVGLMDDAGRKIGTYSTGMMTRLGIAAALMNDPVLLIRDEPTSGLDPAGRKQTIELIRELTGRDRTIIIATHILSDVERVCSDVGIISQGRMIYTGPMSDMRRLARQGTISVEIEGNTTAFEQQIHTLDEIGSVRYERLGAEFRLTFLGTEALPEYITRVLQLIDRTGVELLHINTGADEIEEAFLRRLEEDRTRGFLRAAAWAATQELSGAKEESDAGIPGHPSV